MNKKYVLKKDSVHGYLRADPIPTPEEVERYYKEEFYANHKAFFNDSSLEVQLEEKDFYDGRRKGVLEVLKGHFGFFKGLTLFDIGFGFAQELLFFRDHGFFVTGVEPSAQGFEYAKARGLDVRQGAIEGFSFSGENRFDVVNANSILEHLRDPAALLQNIREKLLKPEGVLILTLPNDFNDFQVIADKEFELDQWWFCPPTHINYFSCSSIKSLLNNCGYDVFHAESSFPLELFLLMGDVYVGNPDLGKICHRKRVQFEALMRKHGKASELSKLYQSLAELNLGRELTLFAVPKEK